VSYAYGESSPAEREAIAAHLVSCATCAEELAALGGTRETLVHWTPPERSLGFQITRTDAVAYPPSTVSAGATVFRPAAWWSRPLPAWAQMAAAVVLFASGVAFGTFRTTSTPVSATPQTATATPVAVRDSVTHEDLAQVEQRLQNEIAQVRTTADASPDTRAVMQRVTQMIAASESRQQKELDFRTSVLASDFATARRIDNANIEQRLRGQNVRVQMNQQDINSLAQRVGYTPSYSPYVP
jgi:uncharacterized protein YkwD